MVKKLLLKNKSFHVNMQIKTEKFFKQIVRTFKKISFNHYTLWDIAFVKYESI